MEKKSSIEILTQLQILIKDLNSEVKRIGKNIAEKIEPIKKYIEGNGEYDKLIKYGIEGYRNSIIKSIETKEVFNPQSWLFNAIKDNQSLRFPHRKILEYLSQKYDYNSKSFKEINYNKIVKECRIGKNKAKEYIKLLIDKGFIKERFDGYRVWYKINY